MFEEAKVTQGCRADGNNDDDDDDYASMGIYAKKCKHVLQSKPSSHNHGSRKFKLQMFKE
jgi:hypothetical protein